MSGLAGEYEGETSAGRWEGFGTYTATCNGQQCVYTGNFENGVYHGSGTMYVKGGKFEGRWENGKMLDGVFIFEDGLRHKKNGLANWDYCSHADPRFHMEVVEGLQNGDPLKHVSANPGNANKVPKGCYDTRDGYFDPKNLAILDYESNEAVRIIDKEEREWIMRNCRQQP